MGNKFWGQTYRVAVLHGGLIIISCQENGSFTDAFSSNLKILNLKIFPYHKDIHLKIKPYPVYRIMERFIPEVINQRFQILCHVYMPQGLGISYKACLFFFNIFSGDLYFDALIAELLQVCLVVRQTVGEGTL